jgi:CRISP-associated protein Cas1
VIGGPGFAQIPEKVQWQVETRNDPVRRLEFSCDLIAAKLRSSLTTLTGVLPASSARALAIARCETGILQLEQRAVRSMEDVRAIEAGAAATYFNAWKGLPLIWRSRWKYPISDAWLTFDGRRSIGKGRFATNRNASHPVNAMLNYAYATLRSQIHIEAASEGYDPCRGIMHHDRDDTQAFVYDLIEPRRPIADAAVLDFVLKTPFTGADFVMRSDGVCRLGPQLARGIAHLAATC